MDRVIEFAMVSIVAFSLYVGIKALTDINDGRIQTVVEQIVNNKAYADKK